MITIIIPDSFYRELDGLKACIDKLSHLKGVGNQPMSYFEKTVMKVIERKKDFQLTGISFTPQQASALLALAKYFMSESDQAKFATRLKMRTCSV